MLAGGPEATVTLVPGLHGVSMRRSHMLTQRNPQERQSQFVFRNVPPGQSHTSIPS